LRLATVIVNQHKLVVVIGCLFFNTVNARAQYVELVACRNDDADERFSTELTSDVKGARRGTIVDSGGFRPPVECLLEREFSAYMGFRQDAPPHIVALSAFLAALTFVIQHPGNM
jgi:hypothetical protein